MPHLVIHCFKADVAPERIEKLSAGMAQLLQAQLGCAAEAVSIDLHWVQPSDWPEQVYRPLIAPRLEALLQRPAYSC